MNATCPDEFLKFITLLKQGMPATYEPFLFRLLKNGKDPCVSGSWKKARLTVQQAVQLLKVGYNIGIAGTDLDGLVIVDVDDIQKTPLEKLKPTLTSRSSKRVGFHAFYFQPEGKKIPNIPTGGSGEVRSIWQYVVCAGSYVPRSQEHINTLPEELKASAGRYTVEVATMPTNITFDELPPVFRERHQENIELERTAPVPRTYQKGGRKSAFYELTIRDVCSAGLKGGRVPHPLHGSENTGKNWSVSGGLGHCWRHIVSLNAQQYLCVESGFLGCEDAGTPHNGGRSRYEGNDEALYHAVKQAWHRGLCGKKDKVPYRVLQFIAMRDKL
ncbi:bifunctional DNA primase/polymerase [Candidatus Woesearchaeota archaeon]|nr:bifunctional DNA primase/polymerase [Candidatus Woesearchaeota archaeon]